MIKPQYLDEANGIVYIYGLYRVNSGTPDYIGKTASSLLKRFNYHKYQAKRINKLPVHRWLNKYSDIEIRLIEKVTDINWIEKEKYWIAFGRKSGWRLLNLTDGGEGTHGLIFTKEHRQHMSEAQKTGQFFSCLECNKEFWRKQFAIKKGNNKFCSKNCYQSSPLNKKSKPHSKINIEKARIVSVLRQKAKTHCPKSHPYEGYNLVITSKGSRACRECLNAYKRNKRLMEKQNAVYSN